MKKSKPHTIRFNPEDYDFICKREGLGTAQSILDFLLSNYMKLYKVEKPSIFFNPTEKSYDGKDMPYINYEEPNQWPAIKIKIRRSFENYATLKKECENEDDWMKLKDEIENADNLSRKQKDLLLTQNFNNNG